MRGKYITLEGGEGCGKSTQVRLLAQYLEQNGIACVQSKEPGSTEEGKIIRQGAGRSTFYVRADSK